MQFRTRRLAALAAALTLSLLGGLGARAATASAATAELAIVGSECEGGDGRLHDYLLKVSGDVDGSYYAFSANVRLMGDDEWYDDTLDGPVSQTYVGGWGDYYMYLCVDSSKLDEDWGRDEVYARVSICIPNVVCPESADSNVIKGYF
jgi:hypothetical protein